MGIPPQIPPADPPPSNEPNQGELGEPELRELKQSDVEPIPTEMASAEEVLSENVPTETDPPEITPEEQYFLSHESLGADERARLLRRLRWVLVTGVASFLLVSWMLVRTLHQGSVVTRGADPAAVVRVELGALASGDLQSAYDQLSVRYRKEVSFEAYHQLVMMHRRVFQTRQYRVTHIEEQSGKTFLEAQLTSATGQHYLARFTLVNTAGRWWIDDLHWKKQGGENLTEA